MVPNCTNCEKKSVTMECMDFVRTVQTMAEKLRTKTSPTLKEENWMLPPTFGSGFL